MRDDLFIYFQCPPRRPTNEGLFLTVSQFQNPMRAKEQQENVRIEHPIHLIAPSAIHHIYYEECVPTINTSRNQSIESSLPNTPNQYYPILMPNSCHPISPINHSHISLRMALASHVAAYVKGKNPIT